METCSTWPSVQTMCCFSAREIAASYSHTGSLHHLICACAFGFGRSLLGRQHIIVQGLYFCHVGVFHRIRDTAILLPGSNILLQFIYFFNSTSLVPWFDPKLCIEFHIFLFPLGFAVSFLTPTPVVVLLMLHCKWV